MVGKDRGNRNEPVFKKVSLGCGWLEKYGGKGPSHSRWSVEKAEVTNTLPQMVRAMAQY